MIYFFMQKLRVLRRSGGGGCTFFITRAKHKSVGRAFFFVCCCLLDGNVRVSVCVPRISSVCYYNIIYEHVCSKSLACIICKHALANCIFCVMYGPYQNVDVCIEYKHTLNECGEVSPHMRRQISKRENGERPQTMDRPEGGFWFMAI